MMNTRIRLLAAWVASLAAACAAHTSEVPAGASTVAAEDLPLEEQQAYIARADSTDVELVCRREHRVGTNFKQISCYTRADIDIMRRAAQDTLQQHVRGPHLESD